MRDVTLHLAAGSVLDLDPVDLIEVAASVGFDGIGLRLSHDHAVDAVGARRVEAALAATGLALHDVEVHRIGSGVDVGVLADGAARLGAARLLVVSDLVGDDALARTEDELGRVVERCRQVGLAVGLEYMAWTTPDSSDDAVRLARQTGCVVVLDVLHHTRVGEGADEVRHLVESGRLGWLQLCDAPAQGPGSEPAALVDEARHRRLPPGHGELPLLGLVQQLPDGVAVSVEVQSDDLARGLSVTERVRLLHDSARAVLRPAHPPNSTG
ncbi:MAG: hypothetical protein RI958_1558 [Actinomycetota bacterium]